MMNSKIKLHILVVPTNKLGSWLMTDVCVKWYATTIVPMHQCGKQIP